MSGRLYTYEPEKAAMWIAIRQYSGDLQAAAARLADEWDEEECVIRADLEDAVVNWQNVGLIRRSSSN
ncbi:hypothetical protein ACWD3J_39930 [Streptomyces sp. NPDC002755]